MRPFAVLLLFLSIGAQAQPYVSEEIVWRTMPPAKPYILSSRAVPVAADGEGFVAGWTEFDTQPHACAGRLDARGRLIEVGVCSSGVGDAATIVPFGDRYLAAWLEPGSGPLPTLVAAALDHHFNVLRAGPVAASAAAPIVHVTDSAAYVASGTMLYELDRDGATVKAEVAPHAIDDFATTRDQVAYVVHSTTHTPPVCGFFRCSPAVDTYTLDLNWLGRAAVGWSWRFAGNAPAAIAGNGTSFLIAYLDPAAGVRAIWYGGAEVRELAVAPPPPDPAVQPQPAWDGSRWVVVWANGGGIAGAVIDTALTMKNFSVTARGARPSLAVSKPGRLLVTYEVNDPGARRLASRVIDFSPPPQRERATR